jgi:hypothetical protein
MKFKGGEFSTGTTGNFQPELTYRLIFAFWAFACAHLRLCLARGMLSALKRLPRDTRQFVAVDPLRRPT